MFFKISMIIYYRHCQITSSRVSRYQDTLRFDIEILMHVITQKKIDLPAIINSFIWLLLKNKFWEVVQNCIYIYILAIQKWVITSWIGIFGSFTIVYAKDRHIAQLLAVSPFACVGLVRIATHCDPTTTVNMDYYFFVYSLSLSLLVSILSSTAIFVH
jgi:hypothetical protein